MSVLRRIAFLCLYLFLWTPAAIAAGIAEYELGAGDKIKIHVFGEPDLDMEVRLDSTGNVNFPFLGNIHASGGRLSDLEAKLIKGLSGDYLINPQVRVSIEEFRPFFVNDEVKSPGAYPYKPDLNARKGISLAGGFNEHADENKIFLMHGNDPKRQEKKITLETEVQPGDIITVKSSFFFVNGEVEKPGKYSYHSGMTYRQAIAIGGGMKERADEDKVYVIHEGTNKNMRHVDDVDAEIKPGDVIIINQSLF